MKTNQITIITLLLTLYFINILDAQTVLNHQHSDNQRYPSICKLSNGNLVVLWHSDVSDSNDIKMGIFTPNLNPIYDYDLTVSNNLHPSSFYKYCASSEDSFFIVIYSKQREPGSDNYDVFIKKYDNYGNVLVDEIRVNQDTISHFHACPVVIDESNNIIFVVICRHIGDDPWERDYYLIHYDYNLNVILSEVHIYECDGSSGGYFDFAILSESKLMATCHHEYTFYHLTDIRARHFNYDGTDQSEIFHVSTINGGPQFSPDIITVPGEGVLIAWAGVTADEERAVWGRRYDTDGFPIDNGEIILSYPGDYTEGLYQVPNAAFDSINNIYAICWDKDPGNPFRRFKPYIRFFNRELFPITDTIPLGEYRGFHNSRPKCLYLNPNTIFACWTPWIDDDVEREVLGDIIDTQTDITGPTEHQPTFILYQNYPNPFNERTIIEYQLHKSSQIKIDIYDILGRHVKTLLDIIQQAGYHQVRWDAKDKSTGIYLYKIQIGYSSETKKMILLR